MATKKSPNHIPKFHCDSCNYSTHKGSEFNKHLITQKHKISITGYKKSPDDILKFQCESCNYSTHKGSEFNKHLLTNKHKICSNISDKSPKISTPYSCKCGKKYKHHSSYYKHKQKCKINTLLQDPSIQDPSIQDQSIQQDNVNLPIIQELVISLMKQNNDMMKQNHDIMKDNIELKQMMNETQKKMLEVLDKGTHHITNNNNIKNKFNLNFFLNETCKNAMNITEFVNNIQLQLGDLEKIGEIGYVNGMSDIIVKNLNGMEVNKRPIHCTDKKRQTLYIKDENKWEKEDKETPKVKKVIQKISYKNMQQLVMDYQKKYPHCLDTESEYNDKYNDIISKICGNGDKEQEEIVKNISREIIVGKEDE